MLSAVDGGVRFCFLWQARARALLSAFSISLHLFYDFGICIKMYVSYMSQPPATPPSWRVMFEAQKSSSTLSPTSSQTQYQSQTIRKNKTYRVFIIYNSTSSSFRSRNTKKKKKVFDFIMEIQSSHNATQVLYGTFFILCMCVCVRQAQCVTIC